MTQATFDDFMKVDLRVGVIREVLDNEKARKPAYKIRVDFGSEIGEKWSSVQATHYPKESLIGRQVIAVVNFPPRVIAGFASEVLILGAPDEEGKVVLLQPDHEVVIGGRVY